ncbi:putative cytochrome P450 [Microdochium bolleyi]|uniref:Putative cytochrome P450 n=1 Tax=Microdochium bolleyi TaxID=196109 RepID=A0A136JA77_9PEZI|nr:putative cytochrome P450 [Microdochium bolleyi]
MSKEYSPTHLLLAGIDTVPAKSLIAASGLALSLYILYRQALPKPLSDIPYDDQSAKRIMGDVPHLLEKIERGEAARMFWIEMFEKHASPVTQYFMGPTAKSAVAIGDYREVHDLLLRHGKDLSRGHVNAEAWRGTMPAHFIGMEDENPAFKSAKALGKDLMLPSFLHEVNAPASYEKVMNIVELWKLKSAAAEGHAFDASVDLGYLTYDIIMAAATNLDDNDTQLRAYIKKLGGMQKPATLPASQSEEAQFPPCELTDMLQSLYSIADAAGKSFSSPSARFFHLFNNRKAEMRKAYNDRDTILREYIRNAVRRLEQAGDSFKPRSAVDFIVMREASAAKKEGREPLFYSDTMVQISFGYLLGGQDSTHSTLSFLVKRLGAYQDVQTRLRETLRKTFPDAYARREQPPLDELVKAQIPYLDAVIEEVLRIDPPANGVMRETKKEMKILGYTVPKNTILFLSLNGPTYTAQGFIPEKGGEALRSETSRSHAGANEVDDWAKSAFPPGEYIPERWLKESEGGEVVFNARAGPFLSFSTGNRVCWGKRLAYLELKLVATVLVWNFVFRRLPSNLEDWVVAENLFLKPKNCRVQLSNAWDV